MTKRQNDGYARGTMCVIHTRSVSACVCVMCNRYYVHCAHDPSVYLFI